MIVDALKYPLRGDDWGRPLGIGAGLLLIAMVYVQVGESMPPAVFVLSFPLILGLLFGVFGYLVRIMGQATESAVEPPAFDRPRALVHRGLVVFGVFLGYLLVPVALIVVEVTLLRGSVPVLAAGLLLVSQGLVVVEMYFLPIAITNYAITDDWRAAFDLSSIVQGGTNTTYLLAAAIAFVLTVGIRVIEALRAVVFILADGPNIVFLLFTIASALIGFYLYMVMARLLSRGCIDYLINNGN